MATKLSLAQQLEEVMDDRVKTAVPRLPDYLVTRFREYLTLQEELDTLEKTLRERKGGLFKKATISSSQQSIYESRATNIRGQMQGLIHVSRAINLGYQPYSPPGKWYVGFASDPGYHEKLRYQISETRGFGLQNAKEKGLEWCFNTPMPDGVIDKHNAAKRTGLFSQFLVAAPNPALFTRVESMLCEPALIGYVATTQRNVKFDVPFEIRGGSTETKPGLIVREGVGFLIAMWDLEKDRRAGGLNF